MKKANKFKDVPQIPKNKFSAVVEAAKQGKPQVVTERGVPAVVVISFEDFAKFRHAEKMAVPSFNEHLLNMPTDEGEFERSEVSLREVAL